MAVSKPKKVEITRAEGLTPSQVIILQVLSKASTGLTAPEISYAGKGVPVNANTIGPVYENSNYPESLRGRGLVKPEQYEGDEVRWFITQKGKEFWGQGFKAQRIGPQKKVPPEVLDPLVIEFKKTRTYGLEHYTEDDLGMLRKSLPKDYHNMDLKDLGKQIQARRKQGAFADPEEKRKRSLERIIREFGPNGSVEKEFLTEEQMERLYDMLGSDVSVD